MPHIYTEGQLDEQPAIYILMSLSRRADSARIFIRRTRDLLLSRLLPGQVELPIGE
jgi:hypothetical protein